MKASIAEIQSQVKPVAERAMEVLEQTRTTVTAINTKMDPILANAAEVTAQAKSVMDKANQIMDRGQNQAVRIDEALTETVDRVRVQLGNVEDTVDHVLRGVRHTSDHVHEGILSPIRQLNGLVSGVSAAVGFLLQGRTTVSRATQDDEMFIG
jgi:ABC-type transporter Mla subunit MlaD